MSNPAKELADRQRHYDLLHHRKRTADLSVIPKLNWIERDMLRQSRAAVADIHIATRSVALSDVEYLRELDAFEAAAREAAANGDSQNG